MRPKVKTWIAVGSMWVLAVIVFAGMENPIPNYWIVELLGAVVVVVAAFYAWVSR